MQSVSTSHAFPQREEWSNRRYFPASWKIFVSALPKQVTVADIREMFKDYEPIIDVWLKPQCFAFVVFNGPEPVEKIMKCRKTFQIRGDTLIVERKRDKGSAPRRPVDYHGERTRGSGEGKMMGSNRRGEAGGGGRYPGH